MQRLLEMTHATRQDREDSPDEIGSLVQQPPKVGAIHDEQPEVRRRDDRGRSGVPVEEAHLAEEVAGL